jgi:hypothetical protein
MSPHNASSDHHAEVSHGDHHAEVSHGDHHAEKSHGDHHAEPSHEDHHVAVPHEEATHGKSEVHTAEVSKSDEIEKLSKERDELSRKIEQLQEANRPKVDKVIAHSKFVVAYYLSDHGSEPGWHKANIEGPVSISTKHDKYELLVKSQFNSNSWAGILHTDWELDTQHNYIFVKVEDSTKDILGLWFKDDEERTRFMDQLEKALHEVGNPKPKPKPKPQPKPKPKPEAAPKPKPEPKPTPDLWSCLAGCCFNLPCTWVPCTCGSLRFSISLTNA